MIGVGHGMPPKPRLAAKGGNQASTGKLSQSRPRSAVVANSEASTGKLVQSRPRSAAMPSSEVSHGQLRLRLGRGSKVASQTCSSSRRSKNQVRWISAANGLEGSGASCLEQQAPSASVASASTQATDQCGMPDFCASQSIGSVTPTHDVIGEPSFCSPGRRPSFSFGLSDGELASAAPPPRRRPESALTNGRPHSAIAVSSQSAHRKPPIASIAFGMDRPRTASSAMSPSRNSCEESGRTRLEDISAAELISNARNLGRAQRSMSSSSLRRPCEEGGVLAGTYRTVRFLGRGTSATVWEATEIASGDRFAVKCFDKTKGDWTSHQKHAVREARLLQNLKHPAIVKFHETRDSPQKFHIILELVKGGSLRELVRKPPSLGIGEESSRRLFQQICDGIYFLHSRITVHRDLKLENILVESETGDAKIIDFGFALTLRSGDQRLRVFCGTPSYMAPELVMNQEYSGFCTDMWALGVVLFAMLTGRLPFEGQTESQLYAKIRRGQFRFPEGLSELPRRLVSGILRIDAAARPTASQALQHRWVVTEVGDDVDELKTTANTAYARPSSVPAVARRLQTTHRDRSLRCGI